VLQLMTIRLSKQFLFRNVTNSRHGINNINVYSMEKETWLPIKGYEDSYEISNIGRVKRFEYTQVLPYGGIGIYKEKILKNILHPNGYFFVGLHKNKKGKNMSIHRLIAIAFIPNPENKPCINHINGVKSDNCIPNLEWVTKKENNVHAFKIGLQANCCKKVINTATGEIFNSIADASKSYKKYGAIYTRQMLSGVCKNKTPFIYFNQP
jgi:hypothetical protein